MTPRSLLLVAALTLPAVVTGLSVGCGSDVVVTAPGGGDGGSGQGGFLFIDSGPPDSSNPNKDAGKDAFEEFVDPGCPDQPPPIEDFLCDPYQQNNGDCPPGEGCYIYVDYPSMPCGQETYGSFCSPQGPGQQGDGCGGGFDCGGGFVCVITGSGTQCVKLCQLQGPNTCTDGMVCEPIDVQGFGGCL